ncbi:YgjP-like metallopeptidase domain-containing protein [Sphingosinicella sp. GR2756]|uniref:YgjP-like metallopeptidase domain-containing protein n=2 Tax=Sphingosinicella rhizophila TaxID=3050082 RepID=A0ABU3Q800_9SPHN|nr:YgjP-like metallopeptidase domain-containing protein [Sphingosinicella sp. GR2756]
MRLRVDQRTATILLTVPRRVSQRHALAWAADQRDWIETQLAAIAPPVRFVPDAVIPLYDLPHRIDWSPERSRLVRRDEDRLTVGGPLENLEARLLRWLKRHAAELLDRETCEFADKAGVSVDRTGVGDPVSRWGSCSSTGAIRYSWRLILAPEWVRRATVAHEVAHRIHMDHSPRFHALVADLLGADPKPARSWLRRNGSSLHRFGRV